MADHVLKVELGEFTTYRLICNLDDTAECHQTCTTHPEGGCGDPDNSDECVSGVYEHGCVVAEWVNDGGIESVEFEHTIELPVTIEWRASQDYPSLHVLSPAPVQDGGVMTDLEQAIAALRQSHAICDDCWYSCPKSGECCNEGAGDECNCGADALNAKVDAILRALPPAPQADASDDVLKVFGGTSMTLISDIIDALGDWHDEGYCDGPQDLIDEIKSVVAAALPPAPAQGKAVECPDPEHHAKDVREGLERCCFCGTSLAQATSEGEKP